MKATTTKTTTQLRDQCLSHCTTPGIPLEPAALDEVLSRAEKESLSHLQFLDLLLGAQAGARRERGVARRIRQARFAEQKTLEGFDWQFNPKAFDRVQIEELATGDFIRRRTNLIPVGWSGVGKSHIIQALGQRACVHGYRVLYRTSAELLSDLTASLADKTFPARLRRYANPDLFAPQRPPARRTIRPKKLRPVGVPILCAHWRPERNRTTGPFSPAKMDLFFAAIDMAILWMRRAIACYARCSAWS